MPTVTNPTLTLTTVGSGSSAEVTIDVTFDAVFTELERNLAVLGLKFHRHINVYGMDPSGSLTGIEISGTEGLFPHINFALTQGSGDEIIPVSASQTVLRSVLQEDTALGDADEIRCKIRIHCVGMPPEFTEDVFTSQQVLLG